MIDDDPGQVQPVYVDLPEPQEGAGGIVRRVRRTTDLSQRELATILGVAQSTVARWETGRQSPTYADVERMLRLARLRPVLVDEIGRPVQPMGEDRFRDRAGRRYPAHLDPYALDWWTPRGAEVRADYVDLWRGSRRAEDPRVRYQRRGVWRDLLRRSDGWSADHPTRAALVATIHRRTGDRTGDRSAVRRPTTAPDRHD